MVLKRRSPHLCADVFACANGYASTIPKQSFDDLLGFLTGAVDAVICGTDHLSRSRVGRVGHLLHGNDVVGSRRTHQILALPQRRFPN